LTVHYLFEKVIDENEINLRGLHLVVCSIIAFKGTVYTTIISTNITILTYQHSFIDADGLVRVEICSTPLPNKRNLSIVLFVDIIVV
jgi:hypothetical protein